MSFRADCSNFPDVFAVNHVEGFWNVTWARGSIPIFKQCPFPKSCTKQGCANTTFGPLCAICQSGYFRVGRAEAQCEQCAEGIFWLRTSVIISFIVVILGVGFFYRRRLTRFRQRIGPAWSIIVRMVAVCISYVQINLSLPRIVPVPWPQVYLDFWTLFHFLTLILLEFYALSAPLVACSTTGLMC